MFMKRRIRRATAMERFGYLPPGNYLLTESNEKCLRHWENMSLFV
jgi:hypothetical protein